MGRILSSLEEKKMAQALINLLLISFALLGRSLFFLFKSTITEGLHNWPMNKIEQKVSLILVENFYIHMMHTRRSVLGVQ